MANTGEESQLAHSLQCTRTNISEIKIYDQTTITRKLNLTGLALHKNCMAVIVILTETWLITPWDINTV